MSAGHWTALLRAMMQRQVVGNAVRVSLFVGTSLNAINQGAQIWRGDGIDWGRILLNYAVPYLVSSYRAAKVRQAEES
jgi:hypothetical protein